MEITLDQSLHDYPTKKKNIKLRTPKNNVFLLFLHLISCYVNQLISCWDSPLDKLYIVQYNEVVCQCK